MTEIKTITPPSVSDVKQGVIRPEDANPELAAVAILRRLIDKWPTPAISSKKFTVIHGLMISLNHTDDNPTYIDTSRVFWDDYVYRQTHKEQRENILVLACRDPKDCFSILQPINDVIILVCLTATSRTNYIPVLCRHENKVICKELTGAG